MHHRTTAAAAALAAALLLTACGDDTDRAGDQAEQTAGTGQPQDAPSGAGSTAAGDLAPGATHTWDDGVSLTVDDLTEVAADQLGEYTYVPEGETPFTAELTLVNASDAPLELNEFSIVVDGTTHGGAATPVVIDGLAELLEGRLAPGETLETAQGWSLDTTEQGRDIAIKVHRLPAAGGDLPAPVWAGTISALQ